MKIGASFGKKINYKECVMENDFKKGTIWSGWIDCSLELSDTNGALKTGNCVKNIHRIDILNISQDFVINRNAKVKAFSSPM